MPFADANGQKLYYTDSGGDGPAVLLSHGFLMGHDNVVGFCAVPGAGHTPNVERPDIVNPAIRSFLDELS